MAGFSIAGYGEPLDFSGLGGALQKYKQRQDLAKQKMEADRKKQQIGVILQKSRNPKTGEINFQSAFQEVYKVDPASAYKLYEYGMQQEKMKKGSEQPMSVKEYDYFKTLNPEEQNQYLNVKRSNRPFMTEVAGGKVLVEPSTTGGKPKTTKLSTLKEEVEASEAMKAKDRELERAKLALDQTKMDLNVERFNKEGKENLIKYETFKQKNANRLEELKEFSNVALRLANNPALSGITGVGRPGSLVPGTKWADADTDRQFLIAKSAIQSMEKLKSESPTGATGFGSMQANELKIIIDNFATLENTKQTPEKMRETLLNIHKKINRWMERQKQFEEKVGYIRGSSADDLKSKYGF